jgi:type 1 fimbria pilin
MITLTADESSTIQRSGIPSNSSRTACRCSSLSILVSLFSFCLMLFPSALAQTTVSQGSIQGTVTDQTNALVPDATIAITSSATGQSVTVRTSSTGTYNSGGLPVGDYVVRVQAKGFKTSQTVIPVQIAVTSPGNFKLEVGRETTTVEVQALRSP